jgi:hypothetical protein
MSRNGSGVYNLPAGNPVVTGTTITSSWANSTMTNIADALTQSVASDGQTPMSGALNMATSKIINLGTPTLSTDAVTKAYADSLIGAGGVGVFSSVTDTGLTATRVTYATTGGLLTDSANLTFNGTTLTAAGFAGPINGTIGATTANTGAFTTLAYTGTLTGGTGIVNLGSGQFYKDASGNVGIGVTSLSYKLQLLAPTGTWLSFTDGTTQTLRIGNTTQGLFYNNANGGYHSWQSAGSEQMRIDGSTGNVGIGTSTPSGVLQAIKSGANLVIGDGGTSLNRFDANDNVFRTGSFVETMRIDSSGNVGIGTTPTVKLEVYDATLSQFRVATFTNGFQLYTDASGTTMGTYTNAPLIMRTNTTERMRITSGGEVLVGLTSTLDQAKVAISYDNGLNQGLIIANTASGTADAVRFKVNGSTVGSINTSTTATLYNTSSDYRLKDNIVNAPSGNIDDVKVRSFDWKSDGSHIQYGFIAQELVEVAPYAVHQPQDPEEMMAVDYSKLVPMMIKEIQDLKQRIKILENK